VIHLCHLFCLGFLSCSSRLIQVDRLPMRLIAALSLPLFLTGCSEFADHGPVSAKIQAQMEAMVVTKAQFLRQMEGCRVIPDKSVSLPFQMSNGVPVLKASINGNKPILMMYDTGASRSLIQVNTVVANKVLVLPAAEATVEMQGVVGKEQGRIGLLNSLSLGEWTLSGYPCLVRTFENKLAHSHGGHSFPDSLLGFDLALDHCSFLTLDYPSNKIIFGFSHPFEAPTGRRVSSAPFKVLQGVPHVTISSGGKTWQSIVDTGSFNGVEISEEVASLLGVQNKGKKIHGLHLMAIGGTVTSGQVNMRVVKLRDLSMLGDVYRDAEVDIAPGPPRVGSFFLKDYRVTFDFRRKRLWLEW